MAWDSNDDGTRPEIVSNETQAERRMLANITEEVKVGDPVQLQGFEGLVVTYYDMHLMN